VAFSINDPQNASDGFALTFFEGVLRVKNETLHPTQDRNRCEHGVTYAIAPGRNSHDRNKGIDLRLVRFVILLFCLALPSYASARAHHTSADLVRRWNRIAIDASGLDHTPNGSGVPVHTFGEQYGPTRASRAMAIVHIAMFDSINAIMGGYHSYTRIHPAPAASKAENKPKMDAALVQSAHDTLVALFPSQTYFDSDLASDLSGLPPGQGNAKSKGIALGRSVAAAILSLRSAEEQGEKSAAPSKVRDYREEEYATGVERSPDQEQGREQRPDDYPPASIMLGHGKCLRPL
jgi:hypothetical protein